jgi:hypothetical protein
VSWAARSPYWIDEAWVAVAGAGLAINYYLGQVSPDINIHPIAHDDTRS